jgi:phage terminase large subunit-like protein
VVAVDPPGSAHKRSDACGLVAAGRAGDATMYVLADESGGGLSPQAWTMKAIALWRRIKADVLVAEANFGGDMVRAVIAAADCDVPAMTVHATRSKHVRAEPVAQLY